MRDSLNAMRKDFQIALVLAVASLPAGLALSLVLEFFPLLKEHPGLPLALSSGATLVSLLVAGGLAIRGEREAERAGGKRRMAPLIGMVVSGLCLVGFAAWYIWPPAEDRDKVPSENLTLNMNFKNFDPNDNTANGEFAFINRLNNDIIVRFVYLAQYIKPANPWKGEIDLKEACLKTQSIIFPLMFRKIRGQIVTVGEGESVFPSEPEAADSNGIDQLNRNLTLSGRRSVTLNARFKIIPISVDKNVMVYCPVIGYIDPSGQNVTAHCPGTYAGIIRSDDMFNGGTVGGGIIPSVTLIPKDLDKRCNFTSF